jgi:predicted RNase H-like HicB family nuclease
MSKYEMIVYWSQPDDCYVVDVPELPGCMADGVSYSEAVSNAELMINEWIEVSRSLGRAIPVPKGRLMYA